MFEVLGLDVGCVQKKQKNQSYFKYNKICYMIDSIQPKLI